MNEESSPKLAQYGLLLLLAFIWGSSFKLMNMGLESAEGELLYTDFELASLRIFFAGAVMYPFSIPILKKIKKLDWLWLSCVGLFGNFIPAFLFASALVEIEPSITGILNSLTPIFALVLGMLLFGQRYKLIQIGGLGLALVGAIGLITIKGASGEVLIVP
ncbi:MAG: DMT family transporter, partial [Flavobacteriales bacterium]